MGLEEEVSFTVDLPSISVPNPSASDQLSVKVRTPSRKRLLIVEDNDDAREMLSILLVQEGHEVHLAHDGPSGLEAALTLRPDAALLDLGLPGFDGYTLAHKIRANEQGKKIHLVALTGYGESQDRLRSAQAGFDDHLVKPVDLTQLALLLQRLNR